MRFRLWPALSAGFIAGLFMVVIPALMNMAGLENSLSPELWGTMLGFAGDEAIVAGIVFNIVLAGLIAILYAIAFRLIDVTDNLWGWGVATSIIHWVLAGLFLGAALESVHPLITEVQNGPDFFALNAGQFGSLAFILSHLVYGALVGAFYSFFSKYHSVRAVRRRYAH